MPGARLLAVLALLTGLLLPAPSRAAVADYAVAVVPVLPPSDIKRRWQPVLDQLGRDTGLHFHFRYYEDNEGFEDALLRDEPDFVMLGPVQMWKVRARYHPLVRDTLPLVGLVVVAKAGPLQRLGDINGKRLGVSDGTDFAASVLLQSLRESRVEPEILHVHTQSNGFRSVILGKVDAATVNNYSMRLLPPEITGQLRIIYHSEELPPPVFAAAVRVNSEHTQRVKAAFLHLRETHPALLDLALMPNITEADLDRDYTGVARLLGAEMANEGN